MKAKQLLGMITTSAILAAACAGSAFADVSCSAVPYNVRNWGNSGYLAVTLTGNSSVWILCSYDQTMGNVTAADCKSFQATLLTALAAQRPVEIIFGTYTDCASVPSFDVTLPAKIQYLTVY